MLFVKKEGQKGNRKIRW